MAYQAERRKYQRCGSTIGRVFMSTDRTRWNLIDLKDISAGGLKFITSRFFDSNTRMYFNIYLYNMLSEFNLEFEGQIVRHEHVNNTHVYAVEFINVDKYQRIQLDEVIKAKIALGRNTESLGDDGVYTYLFVPHTKKARIGNYK